MIPDEESGIRNGNVRVRIPFQKNWSNYTPVKYSWSIYTPVKHCLLIYTPKYLSNIVGFEAFFLQNLTFKST